MYNNKKYRLSHFIIPLTRNDNYVRIEEQVDNFGHCGIVGLHNNGLATKGHL